VLISDLVVQESIILSCRYDGIISWMEF
jgi:hypothetical protein